MEKIPERLQWAVETLGLSGSEAILEIGCGRGVAVSLVCPRLGNGTITAIDRSMAAITAARERNEEFIATGKAAFHQASIEEFDGGGRRFDLIFAVNVNLFWIDAAKGLDPVRRLLTKNGRLFLFYEPPSPAQGERIARQLASGISANGFELVATHEADPGGVRLLGVTARRV